MAKEQNQTEKTTEEKTVDTTETKDTSLVEAVKTSKDFDELLDKSDGVEETPPEDKPAKEVKSKAKDSKTKDDSKADDKNSGEAEDEVKEKTDDRAKDKAGDKAGEESPFSEGLTTRATDIGLTEEEIAQFEDEAVLEAWVKKIEDIVVEADEQEPGSQTLAPPAKSKDDKDGDDSIVKFKDEAEIDPEILANIKAIEKRHNDEVKALRQEVAEMKSGVQKQQQAQFVKRFDGMVDKLGLEFVDVFGRGSLNELGRRSQAYRNRDAVRARMYAFVKGLADSGQDMPDEQVLFDLAVNTLHGKKVEAVKGLRTKTKTDARSKQRIGRAAAVEPKPLTGDEAAFQTSRDFDTLVDSSED